VYDYIVVGTGAGGSVMASRLSEDADVRVLVLEAGPVDVSPHIHMPIAYAQLFKSRHDWDFTTEPEPGLDGRQIYLAQGKVVGGSTSLNGMIYMRGARADYDGWAATGAEGWAYDDILPYFKKAEDNQRGADAYHGVGGPVPVSDNRSRHALAAAFLEAAIEAGHPANPDLNGVSQQGVSWHQLTQRNGRRCSAAAAYLHPAVARPNLELQTDAAAIGIVFEGRRAVAVDVLRHGVVERIRCQREIIVSAGTYQSAVLLMVSGIGPADEIAPLGIDVVENLPVGKDLQDHAMVCVVHTSDFVSLLGAFTPNNLEAYEREGRGPLTSGAGEAGGFISTEESDGGPDFQLSAIPSLFDSWRVVTAHGVSIAGWPSKPSSRGEVCLRAADALTKPRITHNYLATEADRRTMIGGVRKILEIADQPAYKAVVTGPFAVPASGSDDDVLAFAKAAAGSIFHPVGTCAIGQVVDSQLRVLGVDGLRVVDASVMPSIPRGNTNAPTVMIAEKAADIIRAR
jgi:choline dehydrogenase-like flavoprotein